MFKDTDCSFTAYHLNRPGTQRARLHYSAIKDIQKHDIFDVKIILTAAWGEQELCIKANTQFQQDNTIRMLRYYHDSLR